MIWKLLTALAIAYLGWRAWHGWGKLPGTPRPAPAAPARRMDAEEAEARRTLELTPDDGADAVRAAHRRLMARAHPDRGGSADAARRINSARDLLLDRLDTRH